MQNQLVSLIKPHPGLQTHGFVYFWGCSLPQSNQTETCKASLSFFLTAKYIQIETDMARSGAVIVKHMQTNALRCGSQTSLLIVKQPYLWMDSLGEVLIVQVSNQVLDASEMSLRGVLIRGERTH